MAATSQGSSRFAGIKKKSIKPELDVDGRVKKVKHLCNLDVLCQHSRATSMFKLCIKYVVVM